MSESASENRPGHPLAVSVYRQLLQRADVDRRCVYEALGERQRLHADDDRAAMRDALSACARELDVVVPSAAKYERWRRTSPAGVGAPTMSQIVRACGSWSKANSLLLGAPQTDPTRRRLLIPKPRFTGERVLNAAHWFLATMPPGEPPLLARYLAWAGEQPRDADGVAQVPCNSAPITRLFGSWNGLLHAAGVEPAMRRDNNRRRARQFTRDDAINFLKAASEELGQPLAQTRYDAWVRERDRRQNTEPDPSFGPAPIAGSVMRLLGGWRTALKEALGEDALISRGARPDEYTRDELAAAWQACSEHYGHPPTQNEYDAWRYGQMRHTDGTISVPFSQTIARRLGSGRWSGVAAVLGAGAAGTRSRQPQTYTDDDLIAAWRACRADLGRAPHQDAYDGWRHARIREDPRVAVVPCSRTLLKRLGGGAWRGVARAVGRMESGRRGEA